MTHGTVLIAGGRYATLMDRKAGLARAGFSVETASTEADLLAKARRIHPSVTLIESNRGGLDPLRLGALLRSDPGTASLPTMLLGASSENVTGSFDDIVGAPATDGVVMARMQGLLRLATIQDETVARAATMRQFGAEPKTLAAAETEKRQVLVVGARQDSANAVAAALQPRASVTVESDPYRAGDLLERERHDAVVVIMDDPSVVERQLFLCRHIRSNPRFFNLPVVMLAGPGAFASELDPYKAGASVALPLPFEHEVTLAAIDRLVERQRRRWRLRAEIQATLCDATRDQLPGIYSAEFLRAHLHRLIEDRAQSRRALSLVVFGLANLPSVRSRCGDEAASLLLQQAVDFLTGLVRVEDLVARLSETRLCVVLPDADAAAAQRVAERATAVLSHTEFGLGRDRKESVPVWIEAGVATLRAGDAVVDLVNRALASGV